MAQSKPESVMQIGLTADEVLRLPGWGKSSAVRPPKIVGNDDGNLTVQWFYWDMILTLRRRDGCYRVTKIRERSLLGKMWWALIRGK